MSLPACQALTSVDPLYWFMSEQIQEWNAPVWKLSDLLRVHIE